MNEYLTPKEVADILRISYQSVRKMIREEKIKSIVISGDKRVTRRVLRGELDRYVASQYENNKGEYGR